MKKIASILLCIVLLLTVTACGANGSNKSKHSIDIEYYAKLGKISDVDYKLGDNVEEAKDTLHLTLDDHGEPNYYDYPSGEYTVMTDGNVCICYKTEEASSGITHIVKLGEAYGFGVGAMSTQIREVMSNMGYDASEREAKKSETFFLPASSGLTVLEYEIKDNTVLFIFVEHALSATVIY